MIRKHIILICLVSAFTCGHAAATEPSVTARTYPRLTGGLELGFVESVISIGEYCYNTIDGRVYDTPRGFDFASGGCMSANFGCNFTRKFGLSLNAGMSLVSGKGIQVPVTMRATIYPHGCDNNGMFCFAGAGAGFNLGAESGTDALGTLGAGYRKKLPGGFSLDFSLRACASLGHPAIKDPNGGYVNKSQVFVSNACNLSAAFGVALIF